MIRNYRTLVACGVACAVALMLGGLAVMCFGYEPPTWLVRMELVLLSGAALAFGFTAWQPASSPLSRPVRGTVCVFLGIGVMYVPANFIVCAFLLGTGTRLLWAAACDLTPPAARNDLQVRHAGTTTCRQANDRRWG
jgi:hypothetical protein